MPKKDIEQTLANRDWEQLIIWARADRNIVRQLVSRIYVQDGLLFWRAVEALGVVAHVLEQEDKNITLELLRRYFWMLNEESGGTAWNSSAAIGSIIAHSPQTCGHFNWMMSDLLEDDSLREGALWGFCQIAQNAPQLVEPLADRIKPYLEAGEPLARGLAALIFSLMRPAPEAFPLFREAGPKWQASAAVDSSLRNDLSRLEFYQDGKLKKSAVSDLWQAPIVSFWTEKVEIKGLEADLTVASVPEGLCWLALGSAGEEEETLRAWAAGRLPEAFLVRRREANSQVLEQLQEYFRGERREFTLPLRLMGTEFQRQVWCQLCQIPYGETRSYGELAVMAGNPKASRAVGMANNRNPVAIVVPCHRVIGKDGSLTGYGGGLDLKEKLLQLEGALTPDKKTD